MGGAEALKDAGSSVSGGALSSSSDIAETPVQPESSSTSSSTPEGYQGTQSFPTDGAWTYYTPGANQVSVDPSKDADTAKVAIDNGLARVASLINSKQFKEAEAAYKQVFQQYQAYRSSHPAEKVQNQKWLTHISALKTRLLSAQGKLQGSEHAKDAKVFLKSQGDAESRLALVELLASQGKYAEAQKVWGSLAAEQPRAWMSEHAQASLDPQKRDQKELETRKFLEGTKDSQDPGVQLRRAQAQSWLRQVSLSRLSEIDRFQQTSYEQRDQAGNPEDGFDNHYLNRDRKANQELSSEVRKIIRDGKADTIEEALAVIRTRHEEGERKFLENPTVGEEQTVKLPRSSEGDRKEVVTVSVHGGTAISPPGREAGAGYRFVIGPEGGTIALTDRVLEFPPNADKKERVVTVTFTANGTPQVAQAVDVRMGPDYTEKAGMNIYSDPSIAGHRTGYARLVETIDRMTADPQSPMAVYWKSQQGEGIAAQTTVGGRIQLADRLARRDGSYEESQKILMHVLEGPISRAAQDVLPGMSEEERANPNDIERHVFGKLMAWKAAGKLSADEAKALALYDEIFDPTGQTFQLSRAGKDSVVSFVMTQVPAAPAIFASGLNLFRASAQEAVKTASRLTAKQIAKKVAKETAKATARGVVEGTALELAKGHLPTAEGVVTTGGTVAGIHLATSLARGGTWRSKLVGVALPFGVTTGLRIFTDKEKKYTTGEHVLRSAAETLTFGLISFGVGRVMTPTTVATKVTETPMPNLAATGIRSDGAPVIAEGRRFDLTPPWKTPITAGGVTLIPPGPSSVGTGPVVTRGADGAWGGVRGGRMEPVIKDPNKPVVFPLPRTIHSPFRSPVLSPIPAAPASSGTPVVATRHPGSRQIRYMGDKPFVTMDINGRAFAIKKGDWYDPTELISQPPVVAPRPAPGSGHQMGGKPTSTTRLSQLAAEGAQVVRDGDNIYVSHRSADGKNWALTPINETSARYLEAARAKLSKSAGGEVSPSPVGRFGRPEVPGYKAPEDVAPVDRSPESPQVQPSPFVSRPQNNMRPKAPALSGGDAPVITMTGNPADQPIGPPVENYPLPFTATTASQRPTVMAPAPVSEPVSSSEPLVLDEAARLSVGRQTIPPPDGYNPMARPRPLTMLPPPPDSVPPVSSTLRPPATDVSPAAANVGTPPPASGSRAAAKMPPLYGKADAETPGAMRVTYAGRAAWNAKTKDPENPEGEWKVELRVYDVFDPVTGRKTTEIYTDADARLNGFPDAKSTTPMGYVRKLTQAPAAPNTITPPLQHDTDRVPAPDSSTPEPSTPTMRSPRYTIPPTGKTKL